MRMQATGELHGAGADAAAFAHLAHHHHQHLAQHPMHLLPPPGSSHGTASAGGFSLTSWHHLDDDAKRPHYEPHMEQHYEDDGDDFGDHDENDDEDGGGEYAHASSVLALPLGASAASTAVAMATAAPAGGKAQRKTKREIFICPEVHCGKQFPRSFALRRHMRIHTGTKPYACDHPGCPQKFNTSGNLSRHKRIHSGERPYPCVYASCGKKFNTSTKLKRHMRIHFPDGQNLFQCTDSTCSWACDNYKEYITHLRLHEGVTLTGGAPHADVKASAPVARKATKSKAAAAAAAKAAPHGAHLHIQTDMQAMAPVSPGGQYHHQARRPTEFLLSHHQVLHPSSPESAHFANREYDDRRTFGHTFDLREHQHHRELGHHHSSSSSLHERDLDLDHEYESGDLHHHQSSRRHVKQEDRPRLPFPTQSFPSESSFTHHHHQQQQPAHRAPFYEYSGSFGGSSGGGAYPSYMRGPHDGGYTSNQHQHLHHQDNSGSNSSSGSGHSQHHQQQYDAHHYGRRSEDSGYESPVNARAAQVSEEVKYAYATAGIAPTPEFTGEELSAVLELMKDS